MAEKQKTLSVADDFMDEARERFKESETGMEDIIEKALEDITMVDGEDQWAKDVKKFREDHGLVIVTENLLPSYLDQVEGDFRQNKPQVNCIAVDDKADPKTARVLAGMIRNIHYQSQAESIHDEAFMMALSSSYGCWRVNTQFEDAMSWNKEIVIEPIENHLAVRWDMTCKKFDTSDKRWTMIQSTMRKDEYEKKYGEKNPAVSVRQAKGTEMEGWFLDDAVKVAEYWRIEDKDTPIVLLNDGSVIKKNEFAAAQLASGGMLQIVDERVTQIPEVSSCIINGEKILEGPFLWPGKYIPIPICFGKRLNLNGKLKLKSLIRDAKESQRMHNYLISSMVQGVAMQTKAPYVGTTEQFKDKKKEWQAGLDGDVPFLTYNPDSQAPGAPQRQTPPMASQGFTELIMLNNKTRMDIIGIHEAGLGQRSNEQSGVAIQARQREGDTGTFVFIDNFRKALQFEGKIQVDLIPKIYDTPRMQRILGIDGKDEFVQLYEQAMGPQGQYLKVNPKVGKYDVTVTTGPSFTSQREETNAAMIQLVQASGPQSPSTQIMMPGIIKNMQWLDSEKISKALIAMLPPNIQQIMNEKEDEQGNQPDPQVQAMQAQISQQVQQMQEQAQQAMQQAQEQIQKLEQDNQQLKSGAAIKMQELQANVQMAEADRQLEREKIMSELTQHENELKQKREMFEEELKAKMAADLTALMEKIKADHSIKMMEMQHSTDNAPKVEDKPAKAEKEQPQNLTVVLDTKSGQVKKTISLKAPNGQTYTGEVTEGE